MKNSDPWFVADTFDLAADTQINSITYRNVKMTAAFCCEWQNKVKT